MTANNYPSLAFNSGYAAMIDGDTNPTPTHIRVLQSLTLDMKATNKELFGQNIFPIATGRSQVKVEGKIKFADYQPRMIRDFIGAPNNSLMAAGQTLFAEYEAHPVPAVSTYTITVTNSATFGLDFGVVYAATGIPFTEVASAPALGQYSYAAGIYTFAAADASAAVLISYTYTLASAGDTVTLSNTSAGAANSFQCLMGAGYNGLQVNTLLYSCIPSSLKVLDTKIGDFAMPELAFNCVVNAAGNLGIISIPVTS